MMSSEERAWHHIQRGTGMARRPVRNRHGTTCSVEPAWHDVQRGTGMSRRPARNRHVTTSSEEPPCHDVQLEMCSTSDVSDQYAVFEVGGSVLWMQSKGSNSHLKQYPLTYWQPVKPVMKNWHFVLILVSTDHQMQQCSEPTNDL